MVMLTSIYQERKNILFVNEIEIKENKCLEICQLSTNIVGQCKQWLASAAEVIVWISMWFNHVVFYNFSSLFSTYASQKHL